VAGALVGYLLLAATGPRQRTEKASSVGWERTEKTSYPSWNPAAVLAVVAAIALVVGLSLAL
jgi:hypothetical protein